MTPEFGIQSLCRFFGVSRSGFYAWNKAQTSPAPRRLADQKLAAKIKEVHAENRGVYGSPRITRALLQAGTRCGHNRIARLMREQGLRGAGSKRFVPRTTDSNHHNPVAPNRLRENPPPATINEVWVTDITYLPSKEGWLYLAAVMDLASRKIIGWHLEDHLQTSLPLEALLRAVAARRPAAPLIHHSDRGCQYTSSGYAEALRRSGLLPSMSATGCCYDNAAMESFWSTLKREIGVSCFNSQPEARREIFDYIEAFYNRKRLHSSLGYKSPEAFENERNEKLLNPDFERKERQENRRSLPSSSSLIDSRPKRKNCNQLSKDS